MAPHRSTSRVHAPRSLIAGLLAAVLVAASLIAVPVAAASGTAASGTAPAAHPSAGCDLRSANGRIKHVIYIQFDNTHFLRDNPNVPSDLEQMPNLLNFIRDNGTLLANDHTVLISHTAGGILSSLTGLYPDRTGQAVSNAYGYFRPNGSVGFSSSFKYWTDAVDGGNPANDPPTPSADTSFNMLNADSVALGGTGASRNAPAPWVPYARAGCDVGNIGTANAVLENNNAIVFRAGSPGPTTLAAAAAPGATNIRVASVAGFAVGRPFVIDTDSSAEQATVAAVGTAGATGTGIDLAAPLAQAHASAAAVYGLNATDPTGDMTKVFGEGSDAWREGRASQIAPSGTAARALAQTDFAGIAVHCGAGGGICAGSSNATPDVLPDEAGGYAGYRGLFGAKYVNPAITADGAHPTGTPYVLDTTGAQVVDPFGQPGFPGFDGMFARSTLGYVAQMQEAGVPVTFAYISDAHDNHGNAGNIHVAYGPGEAGYVQQLRDYDQAFGTFFDRLKLDGITKANTLFVFTVEEGDHFAGTAPDGPCDGVTTACTYTPPAHRVSEVNGDLKALVATANALDGTTATTDFSVHADLAPNTYITGNPARDSATARTLERVLSGMHVTNPLSGVNEPLFIAMADPVQQALLHMSTADPARLPTFTPFAQGDYFLNASSATPCGASLDACVFVPPVSSFTFAWNHGGIQPEIATTWTGIVGPGVEVHGVDRRVWTDHTDIRPTMLALLGLRDSYVADGRVVTEILSHRAVPPALAKNDETIEALGAAWKQVNAPFGSFAKDTLVASTAALASDSPGDATYTTIETRLAELAAARDALAGKIRAALFGAEFKGRAISERQANAWIREARRLLRAAHELAAST